MIEPAKREFWLVLGSQHLYGPEALEQVEANGRHMAEYLDRRNLFGTVKFRGVMTTPGDIDAMFQAANAAAECAGVILWSHTFSPAQMWTSGLKMMQKPILHLHTQFSAELPWAGIDMDYMNLHQAAHGDRELAHELTRLAIPRTTVVGHWQEQTTLDRIDSWMRMASACAESRQLVVARIGDNMRSVAVTEGSKPAARELFGWQINGYGVGDLVAVLADVGDQAVQTPLESLFGRYSIPDPTISDDQWRARVAQQVKIQLGLEQFLQERGAQAFTTTFEDLHGMPQLPGLAAQELMAKGFGFGAEGDWKTAALLRVLKVATAGRKGGATFMEAYTYDMPRGLVLGAHMLEVCPSVAVVEPKPRIEVHPLSIGDKDDPARLVFDVAPAESALDICLVDRGDGFVMIANEVECIAPPEETPNLPVAKAVWRPKPDFSAATEQWLEEGGSHHTVLTNALSADELRMLAKMLPCELVLIN